MRYLESRRAYQSPSLCAPVRKGRRHRDDHHATFGEAESQLALVFELMLAAILDKVWQAPYNSVAMNVVSQRMTAPVPVTA